MRADAESRSLDGRRPSVETPLHVEIYRRDQTACAVLHPHSINATLPSKHHRGDLLQDYELLKALPGIDTHRSSLTMPIFRQ